MATNVDSLNRNYTLMLMGITFIVIAVSFYLGWESAKNYEK